jgi:hypothetical protein
MAHFCEAKSYLSAKKQLYGMLKAFIKTLEYKRRLFDMSNTGVYDADPWKELKCNKLVVSVSGSSLHHTLCYTLLMTSKQPDVLPGC